MIGHTVHSFHDLEKRWSLWYNIISSSFKSDVSKWGSNCTY